MAVDEGESGHGSVPVAFQVQMVFQPADELHSALREPVGGVVPVSGGGDKAAFR